MLKYNTEAVQEWLVEHDLTEMDIQVAQPNYKGETRLYILFINDKLEERRIYLDNVVGLVKTKRLLKK